jgi:hypothetical protein
VAPDARLKAEGLRALALAPERLVVTRVREVAVQRLPRRGGICRDPVTLAPQHLQHKGAFTLREVPLHDVSDSGRFDALSEGGGLGWGHVPERLGDYGRIFDLVGPDRAVREPEKKEKENGV